VDGTLTFGHLHESRVADETIQSIKNAIDSGLMFFPATGRTRLSMNLVSKGAISSIFGGLTKTPGVYQQGLMVYGKNGELIWERLLPVDIISKVSYFCEKNQVSLLAYCGEEIYRKQPCEWTDLVESYGDPKPSNFPQGLDQLHASGIRTHKMILMANDEWLQEIRPSLQREVEGIASLTQAVPGMLEVLPFGSSKGDGVSKLLEHIGISPENTVGAYLPHSLYTPFSFFCLMYIRLTKYFILFSNLYTACDIQRLVMVKMMWKCLKW
jgi:hydroxymethylpyrimidine pyrophosphatase-like HAD family hydrolase